MLFCCFIYHGGLQSRSVTYVKPKSVFIAWGRTLAEPFPLGQAQSAFLPRSHVPGPYYRAEYGCHNRNEKGHLLLPPVTEVHKGLRGMSKWPKYAVRYDNGDNSITHSNPVSTPARR
jgi:hypothetical protein